MKKFILISLSVLFVLIGLAAIYLFIDPELPNHTDEVITEITSKKIPELITGETGYAKSGSVNIWYEIKNKSLHSKGSVLLLNGSSQPSTDWNQNFIKSITDSGYQLIRFDYRGSGFSDWIENWDSSKPYTIEDMISDAIAVLDQNGIEKVHLVGYSLGGYIAQKIAIDYPGRVLSLTVLSSTADLHDKDHPKFNRTPLSLIKLYLRAQLVRDDKSFLKFLFKFSKNINANDSYDMDLKLLGERGLYELHNRRGYNPDALKQHKAASKRAESLYNELDKIKIPTLIVHGKKDPILSFELAKKYSGGIAGSKKVWIDEAGHIITSDYVDKFRIDFFKILDENAN